MTPIKHLLAIETLSRNQILDILDTALDFLENPPPALLAGKTVALLFFENSTRTRISFELAAKRLGAHVVHFDQATSSVSKGESLVDTAMNLAAMGVNLIVLRHPTNGAPAFLAEHLKMDVSIINAGDGSHEHPSQALLDLFTIRQCKGGFEHLKVAIVGDILHSRVARSLIYGLQLMGVEALTVVGPKTLLPTEVQKSGVQFSYDLATGIEGADVIVVLRLQKERMESANIPSESEYRALYEITPDALTHAKSDVIVMHPGPINREVEIASSVADGPHSVILQQVRFGVLVRMAIMKYLQGAET